MRHPANFKLLTMLAAANNIAIGAPKPCRMCFCGGLGMYGPRPSVIMLGHKMVYYLMAMSLALAGKMCRSRGGSCQKAADAE